MYYLTLEALFLEFLEEEDEERHAHRNGHGGHEQAPEKQPEAQSLVDILEAVLLAGALGGTFAPGSVAIARRAELREAEERYLLTSGDSP